MEDNRDILKILHAWHEVEWGLKAFLSANYVKDNSVFSSKGERE